MAFFSDQPDTKATERELKGTSCRLGSSEQKLLRQAEKTRRTFMGRWRTQSAYPASSRALAQLNIDYRSQLLRRLSNAAGCHLSTIIELITILARLLDRVLFLHHHNQPRPRRPEEPKQPTYNTGLYSPSIDSPRQIGPAAMRAFRRDFRTTIEQRRILDRICTNGTHSIEPALKKRLARINCRPLFPRVPHTGLGVIFLWKCLGGRLSKSPGYQQKRLSLVRREAEEDGESGLAT